MAHKKRHHASHRGAYEGHSERRRQEMEDAGMIREDRSEVANLPQEVKYGSYWGRVDRGYLDSDLDDTIRGVDRQMDKDESQGRKGMNPHKY